MSIAWAAVAIMSVGGAAILVVLIACLWQAYQVVAEWKFEARVTEGEGIAKKMSDWKLSMLAEPIVPPFSSENDCNVNGAELQRAVLRGFANHEDDAIWTNKHRAFTFEKEFNFKEHGEFFRGALTMASLRYAGDFYELLKRYGKIKVTITKFEAGVTEGKQKP